MQKSPYRLLWWAVAAVFAAGSYGGWQFIRQARESAAGSKPVIESPNPVNIGANDWVQRADPSVRAGQSVFAQAQGASTGSDLLIRSGEFAYRDGEPQVRLLLQNQSGFSSNAAYISLWLHLDDAETAEAEAVGIPVHFEQTLESGGQLVVEIPIEGEAWRSETVRLAAKRRIWAQIISVSDADNNDIDYPQTSAVVQLKQVDNDSGEEVAAASDTAASAAEELDGTAGLPETAASAE